MDKNEQKRAVFAAQMGVPVDEERLLVSLAAIRMARLQPKMTIDYLRKTVNGEIPLASGMLEVPASSIQTEMSEMEQGIYAMTTRESDALRAERGDSDLPPIGIRDALALSILVQDEAKELKAPLTYLLTQGEAAADHAHARAEIVETLAQMGESLADRGAPPATIMTALSATLNAKADEVFDTLMNEAKEHPMRDELRHTFQSRRAHLFDDFERDPDIEMQWQARIKQRQDQQTSRGM